MLIGVMATSFTIGKRIVGDNSSPYIIAELSANHAGSLEVAIETVRAAAEAGADAIKLQTYTPDTMTLNLDRSPFIIGEGTIWSNRKLYDLYGEAMTPWEWHGPLFDVAQQSGIDCFSSPFDETAVDFLRQFSPPAVKIASFEIVDHSLISVAATMGVPLIMSTGMATEQEIADAVETASTHGAPAIGLLRCSSAYPAKVDELDLCSIEVMQRKWRVPIGFSDHTVSDTAAVVAVSLGATIIEKHFILDRTLGGPDSSFSLEPAEFARFVRSVREAHEALGGVRFGPSESEVPSKAFRRSLWICADVKRGEVVTSKNVRALRPEGGMNTKHLRDVIGRTFSSDYAVGTPLTEECIL